MWKYAKKFVTEDEGIETIEFVGASCSGCCPDHHRCCDWFQRWLQKAMRMRPALEQLWIR